jgi:hypothetical protein
VREYCRSIREALTAFFDAGTRVSTFGDMCVVTLPLRTLDGRFVDVFVEQKLGDMWLVHDAGKSSAELYAQGIHDTDKRMAAFERIASRYGAVFSNDVFSVPCKSGEVHDAILSVAQCATLAMHDVATVKQAQDEESVKQRVGKVLYEWQPSNVQIERDYTVRGTVIKKARHRFDYAALPISNDMPNVGVSVLLPTYNPTIQSEKYGFLALDLRGSAERWSKLAIIGKVDEWHKKPLDLVRSLAEKTIELPTGDVRKIEAELPTAMRQLMQAA